MKYGRLLSFSANEDSKLLSSIALYHCVRVFLINVACNEVDSLDRANNKSFGADNTNRNSKAAHRQATYQVVVNYSEGQNPTYTMVYCYTPNAARRLKIVFPFPTE